MNKRSEMREERKEGRSVGRKEGSGEGMEEGRVQLNFLFLFESNKFLNISSNSQKTFKHKALHLKRN